MDISFISEKDIPGWIALSRSGDSVATHVVEVMSGCRHAVQNGEKSSCVSCDHLFAPTEPPRIFAVIVSEVPEPMTYVSPLCDKCASADGNEIRSKFVTAQN
jgi:hypothetical protein